VAIDFFPNQEEIVVFFQRKNNNRAAPGSGAFSPASSSSFGTFVPVVVSGFANCATIPR